MPLIHKLDPSVVNQIGAGEVVLQPCSVLKELVENSIDAGASRIEAEWTGSGAESMRVSDNGTGIDRDDLPLAVERFATSKIDNADDLYAVMSCGFRGEALSSIAEVSDFEILTNSSEDSSKATRFLRKSGQFTLLPASRNRGTTVQVKNLFHNVPVRRRFLKSPRAESSQSLDALKRLALARPHIAFRVLHDKKTDFELPEDQSLLDRCESLGIFNLNPAPELLPYSGSRDEISASGLLVSPPSHFGNSQKIFIFVNSRPVTDAAIAKAVSQACDSYLPQRRWPGAIVRIELPSEEVDVNIHPTKSSVRFRRPDQVFSTVYRSIRQALEQANSTSPRDTSPRPEPPTPDDSSPTPDSNLHTYRSPSSSPSSAPASSAFPSFNKRQTPLDPSPKPSPQSPSPRLPELEPAFQSPRPPKNLKASHPSPPNYQPSSSASAPGSSPLKTVQLLRRYILREREDCFEIIDQHAIHERILYNRFRDLDKLAKTETQDLLAPLEIPLPENLPDLQPDLINEIKSFGFDFSLEGSDLLLQSFPAFLNNADKAAKALEAMLKDLAEGGIPRPEKLRSNILHSLACRAAIKAGDLLNENEIQSLIFEIDKLGKHENCCPHGRPAVWRITPEIANAAFDR